ncbi:uncharacterized transcriptional regulatory protein C1327.01c [Aspergillus udagawae]|uniref:Uncharacterized transcriptional regulatory protein C1327.01c n=1 Tax=Aspergillus udagawae TaxID=91492 RepID=A0A8H3S8Y0_9EURO|nr:uncharacterized transcriptional regulatory protein C1327.01c [Aspergillus udagawae]
MTTPQRRKLRRNENIPDNFIQSWQCPTADGVRSVVRRPITACESCRTAKVKCTGNQSTCERCTSRGIPCRYTAPSSTSSSSPRSTDSSGHPKNVDSSTTSNSQSPASGNTSLSIAKPLAVPMSMDWGMDTADPLHLSEEGREQDLDTMVEWPKEMSNYLFDWSSLDLSHNAIASPNSLSTEDMHVFQPLAAQTSPSTSQNGSPIITPASIPAASVPLQSPLPSQGSCQCRTDLMRQVPEVNNAMRAKPQPHLDRIFKVTGNVLWACRDLIKCASCQLSYADLVCIVAVLQQTGTCFEHIASAGLAASAIKVCVGQYEVPIANGIKLRHMLVMDLVAQANCLLSLLRNRGQSLVESQPATRDRLTQINIDYMQEVVKSFEHTLRSIADSLEKPASDGGTN